MTNSILIKQTTDFRMYAAEVNHDRRTGNVTGYFRVCEELIDGRWEGFVSMIDAKNLSELERNLLGI